MVVIPKANSKVRICEDLIKLNDNVCRERYQLPSVEDSLSKLRGARIFTKLDANSGFWQIPLSSDSALMTTFLTPFGRYCFNRLPFRITSALEIFQNRMSTILNGISGTVCQMDDILVYGENQEDHNLALQATLQWIQESGITLNTEKCEFSKTSIKFLGQIISTHRIKPDHDKVKSITEMSEPTNVSELRHFLGMTNHLIEFLARAAELTT